MKLMLVAAISAALLSAQNEAKTPEPKKPPTPKERAREIADKALETVTGAQPQVQVAGLLHLAELYTDFDNARSEEVFRQAFSSAAALPQDARNSRAYMMSQVASVAAEHNLELALEFLPQMGPAPSGSRDFRTAIVDQIVRQLITQKRTERAIEILTSMGSEGEFAFNAAGALMRSLPEDDARKTQIFSSATTAYAARPADAFLTFVSAHWQQVPQPLAEAAAGAILNAIEARRKNGDKESYTQTLLSSKGSVSFTSQENADLFNILHVIRAINPKKADELLESRIELREAISKFPQGRESMKAGDHDGISQNVSQGGSQRDPREDAQMRLRSYSDVRMIEALQLVNEPEKALAIIKQIPLEQTRASALSQMARRVADKDPSTAKSVLTQCFNLLDDIKKPKDTVDAYVDVAEAAHKVQDEERARLALDRAVTGATELYEKDIDAEAPNMAPREYWPSTQSYRRIIYRATSMYGSDAGYMLPKINDPDLHLLASIEMARSLLKKPSRSGSTMTDSTRR